MYIYTYIKLENNFKSDGGFIIIKNKIIYKQKILKLT